MNPRMTQESDNIQLKLKWTQTSHDITNDFVARSPAFKDVVGRFYLEAGSAENGVWNWSMTASGEGIRREGMGLLSGSEPSAREAAKAIEEAWFKAIKGGVLDIQDEKPVAPKNSYAAAKGRE